MRRTKGRHSSGKKLSYDLQIVKLLNFLIGIMNSWGMNAPLRFSFSLTWCMCYVVP